LHLKSLRKKEETKERGPDLLRTKAKKSSGRSSNERKVKPFSFNIERGAKSQLTIRERSDGLYWV